VRHSGSVTPPNPPEAPENNEISPFDSKLMYVSPILEPVVILYEIICVTFVFPEYVIPVSAIESLEKYSVESIGLPVVSVCTFLNVYVLPGFAAIVLPGVLSFGEVFDLHPVRIAKKKNTGVSRYSFFIEIV